MKKNITLLALAVAAMSALFSCSSSSSSTSSSSIHATVNGASYSGSDCVGFTQNNTLNVTGYYGTSSTSTSYPIINIIIETYTGTLGSFTIDNANVHASIDSSATVAGINYATSGTLTVTSLSPNVVGTFSFTCADGTVVTGGTFTARTH